MAFIAPAGTRLTFADLAGGNVRSLSATALEDLESDLCRRSQRERAWLFSTGRAAMVVAFQAMRRVSGDPRRVEVIIPGYTCYSVPAAAERAGLVPRLCDVDPRTLGPDLESLASIDTSRALAIVSSNLYGLPNELVEIERFAREHGIFMLDDAAQALGARLHGRPAGGFGDVGLYSFDKGKNITTVQGGALVAGSGALADVIDAVSAETRRAGPIDQLVNLCKLHAYALLLRPSLYGLVRRLPVGLGLTPYETDYPITLYGRGLAGHASHQLAQLDLINGVRAANAGKLLEALAGSSGLSMVEAVTDAEPVYARFPMLSRTDARAAMIISLEAAGIGATTSYPCALIDVPQVAARLVQDQQPTPGAKDVARKVVTLPTHAYSPADLAASIRSIVDRTIERS